MNFYCSISVLINGLATNKFKTKKGLRQGDPLSPFLFNVQFPRARKLNLIWGIKFGDNGVIIFHLQFAADIIIFVNNVTDEISNFRRILRCLCFQVLSGLKINFTKSLIAGVGVEGDLVAATLFRKAENLEIKYLGIALANPRRLKNLATNC